MNRSHYRKYKSWGSHTVNYIETPIKDTLVPAAFMCHIVGGGIMYRSATPKKYKNLPRKGGWQLKKHRINAAVTCKFINAELGEWIQQNDISLIIADCGSHIHCESCKKLLWEKFQCRVHPRANRDHYFGGYAAYSPQTMPLDEIIFPVYQAKMSKQMKQYNNPTLKSSLQYILYRECKKLWYSREIQDFCRTAVEHQETVLRRLLFPPEFFK